MAENIYRILVINPGSTSTKVGVFDGATEVFTRNVAHEAEKLGQFASVSDQMPYRRRGNHEYRRCSDRKRCLNRKTRTYLPMGLAHGAPSSYTHL